MPPIDKPIPTRIPPRVVVQAPTLPPIITAPAPPVRSYTAPSHAAAYVAAPHHYTPVTPPVAVRPAPKATPKPSAIPAWAQQAPEGQPSPAERNAYQILAATLANWTRIATRNPYTPVASFLATEPLREMAFRGLYNQDFQRLQAQGLLPKGAKLPTLNFPAHTIPGALAWENEGNVYAPPQEVSAGTDPSSPLFGMAQEAPIHEIAHTLQQIPGVYPVNKNLVEGGAQAWTEAVSPKVIGPVPTSGVYADYVRQVRQLGPNWITRYQFQRRRPALASLRTERWRGR